MIVKHSRASYRLVGSLEDGEELVERLTDLCREHGITAGEIRGVGTFNNVELVRFDAARRQYVELLKGDGAYELVHLSGNISMLGQEVVLRLDSVLSVLGPVGPQVVAGQLRAATAVAGEFVLDVFTDLRMNRRLDPTTGHLTLDTIEELAPQPAAAPPSARPAAGAPPATISQPALQRRPEPVPTASAPLAESQRPDNQRPDNQRPDNQRPDNQRHAAPEKPAMSWSEAASKSEERPVASGRPGPGPRSQADEPSAAEIYAGLEDDEEGPALSAGDILDHPKLGRCRVMKVEDDEFAHIRLPRGRISKLSLEVCEIVFKGQEEGRNVFQARVRR